MTEKELYLEHSNLWVNKWGSYSKPEKTGFIVVCEVDGRLEQRIVSVLLRSIILTTRVCYECGIGAWEGVD